MLGGDGPRNYLLVFQNNAEIRATGGLPGSWAEVHAEDGKHLAQAAGHGRRVPGLGHPGLRRSATGERRYSATCWALLPGRQLHP